jgi:hypothetical protein
MNKRIRKKRARLSPRNIGNTVYTAKEMKSIIIGALYQSYLLPMIYVISLDPNKHTVFIWRKNNIKRALKYMYKHYVHLDMNHSSEVD